jgi:hypothetical protein
MSHHRPCGAVVPKSIETWAIRYKSSEKGSSCPLALFANSNCYNGLSRFRAVGAASLRCQPYLHLLRQGGATAQDSLTLDYNGPSFVVAFKAIRRRPRHWVAFMFALVMTSVLYFPGRLSCH